MSQIWPLEELDENEIQMVLKIIMHHQSRFVQNKIEKHLQPWAISYLYNPKI
jgi:hypothetical protein